jgi:L-lactate utilization protein LutB
MAGVKERSGGARPGAGRPQTTYKLMETPARQLRELAATRNMHPEALLAQLIAEAAHQEAQPMQDDAAHLLHLLTPEPQTVETLCKRIRMSKAKLEQVIAEHREELVQHGLHLYTATSSEVAKAIKLPSVLNPDELTYYSKLSRNLFGLQ